MKIASESLKIHMFVSAIRGAVSAMIVAYESIVPSELIDELINNEVRGIHPVANDYCFSASRLFVIELDAVRHS